MLKIIHSIVLLFIVLILTEVTSILLAEPPHQLQQLTIWDVGSPTPDMKHATSGHVKESAIIQSDSENSANH